MTLAQVDIDLRDGKITGTTLGQIVGLSKYGTKIDAYRTIVDKVSNVDPESPDIKRGHFLEPALRAWGADQTGLRIIGANIGQDGASTVVHPKHSFLASTTDSYIIDDDGDFVAVNEIKSPRRADDWGHDGTDQIPDCHVPQVVLQMACTGLPRAVVFALIHSELRVYHIERDLELEAALIREAKQFYLDHVLPGIPPPPDSSKSYSDYLRDRYPDSTKQVLNATPHQEGLLTLYFDSCRRADRADEIKRAARNLLQAEIGESGGIIGEAGKVTRSVVKGRRTTDWKETAMRLGASDELIASLTRTGSPHVSLRKKPAPDLADLCDSDSIELSSKLLKTEGTP